MPQELLRETLVTDAEAAHTHGVHVSASDRLQRHYSLGPRPFKVSIHVQGLVILYETNGSRLNRGQQNSTTLQLLSKSTTLLIQAHENICRAAYVLVRTSQNTVFYINKYFNDLWLRNSLI